MFEWLRKLVDRCRHRKDTCYEEQPYDEDAHLDGSETGKKGRPLIRSVEEQDPSDLAYLDGLTTSSSTLPSLPPQANHIETPVKVTEIDQKIVTNEEHLEIGSELIPGPAVVVRLSPTPFADREGELSVEEEESEVTTTDELELDTTQDDHEQVKIEIESASSCCPTILPTQGSMVTKCADVKTLFDYARVGKGVLDKISFWRGDITKLEIDAIVNAANKGLNGGGGVDGAIHNAAGYTELQRECRRIGHCETGNTVVTSACKLSHVKKIFHTVGPQVWGDLRSKDRELLKSCYRTALDRAVEYDLKSLAFPCISTGIYGYPNDDAARTVMELLVRFFTEDADKDKIERVVLCLFMSADVECYENELDNLISVFGRESVCGSNADREKDCSTPERRNMKRSSTSDDSDGSGEGAEKEAKRSKILPTTE